MGLINRLLFHREQQSDELVRYLNGFEVLVDLMDRCLKLVCLNVACDDINIGRKIGFLVTF